MMKRSMASHVAYFLVFLGALNWGLMALFGGFNLVEVIFHGAPMVVNFVYVLIGFSGLYCMMKHYCDCKGACKK